MEKSTPIGLLIGFSMMIGVLFVGEAKVSLLKFIDPPAMMMVFGGAVAVALVGFPLRQVLRLFAIGKKLFFHEHEDPRTVIDQIVELAQIARKDGLLALERKTGEGQNPLLTLGIQLAVDGARPESVDQILRTEIEAASGRHRENKRVLELVGRCGPAFGMIATLLGLIMMLGNLDDPDTIGPSMAVALIGTLYGAVTANLLCIPMTEKLSYLSHEEMLIKQIVLRGVQAIQSGDSPRIVRHKLETFLPANLRQPLRVEPAAT
jgi:chemotaxis protein MotA